MRCARRSAFGAALNDRGRYLRRICRCRVLLFARAAWRCKAGALAACGAVTGASARPVGSVSVAAVGAALLGLPLQVQSRDDVGFKCRMRLHEEENAAAGIELPLASGAVTQPTSPLWRTRMESRAAMVTLDVPHAPRVVGRFETEA